MNESRPVKVVHFSTTDYGGAYRAAERISACMKRAGIDSQLIVRTKTKKDTDCIEYFDSSVGRFISKAKNAGNLLFSSGLLVTDLFGTDISKSRFVKDADVVVLHWVNSFISYRGVKQLVKTGKKIIWVMHDEWIYTEGVHYTCERPYVSKTALKILGPLNLRLKRWAYSGSHITYVAVSGWIREQALAGSVLCSEDVRVINNPLDTDKFRPEAVTDSGCFENPYNKKIILFGADKATGNVTKGFSFLLEALKELDGNECLAVCFGAAPKDSRIKLDNIDIIYTGPINDDDRLIGLYNSADVMVVPSIQEAFGYTCCEALACGTPVVGFDTSGLKDQIIHKENGYLARPGDTKDLAEGIRYCLSEGDRLSVRARVTAVSRNSYPVIAGQYMDLLGEESYHEFQ